MSLRQRLANDLAGWAKLGINYEEGPKGLLLEHGREWTGAKCEFKPGAKGECFYNAGRLAMDSGWGDYRYVEGVAVSWPGCPILIDHGWLLNVKTGEIHDPTWGASDEAQYLGLVFSPQGHAALLVKSETWDVLTMAQANEYMDLVRESIEK